MVSKAKKLQGASSCPTSDKESSNDSQNEEEDEIDTI